MASSREAKARMLALGEIGSILGAMKNLALLELRKLGRLLEVEQRAVDTIEAAVADLAAFFATARPGPDAFADVSLLVGSERAFCGDFNEAILQAASQGGGLGTRPGGTLVAVGARLATRLPDSGDSVTSVPGACVAEEIPAVLAALALELAELQRRAGEDRLLRIEVWYHEGDTGAVTRRRIAPMPESTPARPAHPYPPVINLTAPELFRQLFDQYLYAALHGVLYSSLAAENQQRLVHMDNAMRRLDERVAGFRREYDSRRQEEITEEIEVILLSAEALADAR